MSPPGELRPGQWGSACRVCRAAAQPQELASPDPTPHHSAANPLPRFGGQCPTQPEWQFRGTTSSSQAQDEACPTLRTRESPFSPPGGGAGAAGQTRLLQRWGWAHQVGALTQRGAESWNMVASWPPGKSLVGVGSWGHRMTCQCSTSLEGASTQGHPWGGGAG